MRLVATEQGQIITALIEKANKLLKENNSLHFLSSFWSLRKVRFKQMKNYAGEREYISITGDLTAKEAENFLKGFIAYQENYVTEEVAV